jgi:hypothetical protein
LDLSNNLLAGSIPSEIGSLTDLLYVAGVAVRCSAPEW